MATTTPAPADAVIRVSQVSKDYGAVHALSEISLECRRGEIFGLIGHNGAGKSTLFRLMLGLDPVSSGSIQIDQVDVTGKNFRNVRRKVGYLPENVVLYDNLTGLETLQFFARLKGAPPTQCAELLEQVGLGHAAQRRVSGYSKGMRQRLGFAQALLGQPQLLFLDEPTNGLDPEAIRDFYRILHTLKQQGVTIILTSHILAEIQTRVDRLALLANGRLQALGTVAQLRHNLNLPVRVIIDAHPQHHSTILQTLQVVPTQQITAQDHSISVTLDRNEKLLLLQQLATLHEQIQDLHIHEASLEDVFFGLNEEVH